MTDLHCSTCGGVIQPTGHSPRVRCPYCGADNLLDRASFAAVASGAPVAPEETAGRVHAALAHSEPQALLEAVAKRLKAALGADVHVETSGGFFSRTQVTAVTATLGDYKLELRLEHGKLVGKRAQVVRGISIRSIVVDAKSLPGVLAADLHALGDAVLGKFLGG